jgi:putative peptidoglycan lipid II flippase
VGTTIATAAFPRLNLRLSQKRPDLFRQDFRQILKTMIWIGVPVCFVTFYCRGYLARLIYTRGDNDISIVLGFLTFAIFSRIMYSIISRWFYSHKDNKTPLFVSFFVIALNIVLAFILAKKSAFGIAGLAIAQSIVGIVEVLILVTVMIMRDRKIFDFSFFKSVFKIGLASIFSGIAGYIMVQFYPLELKDKGVIVLGGKLFLIVGAIFIVHILSSALFRLDEVKPFLKTIKKFILKPIKIQY